MEITDYYNKNKERILEYHKEYYRMKPIIEGKQRLVIGRRIRLLYSKDSTKTIKSGDTGTITDVYIIGRGKIMYSIDWDNENSLPLVEGEDDFEMVKSDNTVIDIEFR